MDTFSFSNYNLLDSTVLNSSGEPTYSFHAAKNITGHEKSSKLHIDKVKSSGQNSDPEKQLMTTIEHHDFRSDVVKIWGKEMKPLHWHDKPKKLLYTSTLNGKEYEWSTENQEKTFKLSQKVIPATSETVVEWKEIAFFQKGKIGDTEPSENNDSLHPTLYAHPEGLDMLDEIISTFVYFLMVQTRGSIGKRVGGIVLQIAISSASGIGGGMVPRW
ncbi:hypothetical protein K435DRAFT_919451 [Dendrothele bispora CBS 962.96]|uniref:DUF6593 domain-containing protein n=1 Tax=Dendrothele bispora (strain CBS 962.96) TaxID=1314807 RepID=A0A4S8LF39_DENBC|nr:hypothetical protein K435DRAFT_919451 [Dendrothele bispora CBS 962.96]